jgi:hypothetical protein
LVYDALEPKPERIYVSITRPRAREDERITLAEYTPQDIAASKIQIENVLERARSDRAKLVPSEEACRYCKGKMICPAFQEAFRDPILSLRPGRELTKTARDAYLEDLIYELSDEQLEKVLVALSFASMIGTLARDEARKRVEAGGLTNYELSKPHEKREITDTRRAISLLSLAKIAERERLFDACTISLRSVEELFRKRTGCTAHDARRKIADVLRDIIEVTTEKPRLLRKNNQ